MAVDVIWDDIRVFDMYGGVIIDSVGVVGAIVDGAGYVGAIVDDVGDIEAWEEL